MYERKALGADISAVVANAKQAALREVAHKILDELHNPPIGTTHKVSYRLGLRRGLKIVEDVMYADWKRPQ